MNQLRKIFVYFLVGCVGVRLFLAWGAKTININYLPILGFLGLLPAFGFAYIYLFNGRKSGKGVFGEHIWWNNLRPLHAALWVLFSVSAILKKKFAWMFLLADVLMGLAAFLIVHTRNGDMRKVFSS